MGKVLIVHHDAGAREMLEAMIAPRYGVICTRDYAAGMRAIASRRPSLIVAGQDADNGDALLLLRYLKNNGVRVPLIVVAGRGAGVHQQAAMKLGAKAFLEYPVDEKRFTETVDSVLAAPAAGEAVIPPLTEEEAKANLTELEKRLNAAMKCFAGRNLVYLQSYIGSGTRARPRICLKCPLRKEYGLLFEMYYEFIRDVCCHKPHRCEAIQLFEARKHG